MTRFRRLQVSNVGFFLFTTTRADFFTVQLELMRTNCRQMMRRLSMCCFQLCIPSSFFLLLVLFWISAAGSRPSANGGHHHLRHSFANKQFIDQLEDGSYEFVIGRNGSGLTREITF
uniref:Cadherin domain-containing protein n=1 Tax=Globodera pallida TaxID=36090 RepID=A0A183CJR2_GLOPA